MVTYFNSNFKKYREMFGYTQTRLAEMIDVDTSQVCRYESGENYPPPDKLVKLASIFHISIEELLGVERTDTKDRKYTEDGVPMINIRNAQVVRRQFFSRVNDTSITIYPEGIRYSTKCIRAWEDTDYIQIIVDEEMHIVIIRKSDEEDMDSQRWCKYKDGKRYSRKITGREFSTRLYRMMNWTSGYMHKISGYVAINEDVPDEALWYFELDEAEAIPMTKSSREKCGVRVADLDTKTLELLDRIEKEREREKTERRRLIDEGKKPGPSKQYVLYPDKWGQYTFGLPSQQHGIVPRVNLKARNT